jgi:hypothetical protein
MEIDRSRERDEWNLVRVGSYMKPITNVSGFFPDT